MIKIDPAEISRTPESAPLFSPVSETLPEHLLPIAVYDDAPELIELWHDTWRICWKHVYNSPAMPYSPYLGEGCATNKIWIWDSCFMALWGCYANDIFPVKNTLDNFYAVMSGSKCDIAVHHPDNPPLFGWAELELYHHTGDRERVKKLIRSRVLQDHFFWRENIASPGDFVPWGGQVPVMLRRLKNGYLWSGNPSGMDNTPRGNGLYQYILWVDALAQHGAFAGDIARLCEIAGDHEQAAEFYSVYEEKKSVMQRYFDIEDGCFYDITVSPPGKEFFSKVLTPASFWPVFAGMAAVEQAESMANTLLDPQKLGGVVASPSVSRDDPQFDPAGGYWCGGIWLPVFYMTMKALDRTGKFDLARKLSLQLLHWMKRCYDEVEPHTIWECYSPTEPMPSTNKNGKFCRRDFCGWSALAPISLLLEDVIGLHSVDAETMTVRWNPPETRGKCGIRNLKLGKGIFSLIAGDGCAEITADCPFTLELCTKKHRIEPGTTTIPILR